MFETTVVAGGGRTSSRRVALLSFSVAAHTFVGAAVLLAGLHSLQFPTHTPKEMATYALAPPPPPMPVAQGVRNPAPAQKEPTPAAAAKIPTAPPADLTPSVVPSTATVAATAPAIGDLANGNSGPGDGTGTEIGPKGDPNGVIGGIPIDAPPLPATPPDRVYRVSEVNPPVVIRRVSPDYPRVAQSMRKSGWVIVECIIDKTGHTRDARVVGSNFVPFEQPALDAVQQWQFRPGTLGGQAVDTLFELRVTFTLQ
jgi:protein TonB